MGGGGGGGGCSSLSKKNPHVFTKGSSVEVLAMEKDYGGVFFAATVIEPPPSSQKGADDKKLHVQYENLRVDGAGSEPLTKCVDVSFLRPEPPRSQERVEGFQLGEMVDAFHNEGWWIGVVTQVVEGGEEGGRRFTVSFRHPPVVRGFGASDLRPHLDWVDGDWVKPGNQVIPVHSLDQDLQIPPYTRQSLTNNRSGKLTPRKGSQGTKRHRSPKPRVSPPPLRKHKRIAQVLSDLATGDSISDDRLQIVPVRRKRSKNGARDVNEKIASLSAPSTRKNSGKLSRRQSTDLLIGGKKSPRPSQDVQTELQRKKFDLPIVMCLPAISTSSSRKSRAKKVQISSGPKRGRGRPRKNSSNVLQSPMDDNLEASDAQIEKNCNAETEEIVTEAPHSRSSLMPVIEFQFPTTIAANRMNLGNTEKHQYPTVGDVLQEGIGNNAGNQLSCAVLPFDKTPGIWEVIESLEVFKRLPQRPHFMPLENVPECSREGLAMGLTVTFMRVVEKTSDLLLSGPKSIMLEILGSLGELESHGFDVRAVRDRVNGLLAAKEKHEAYAEEANKIMNEILLRRDEKKRSGERIDEMKRQMEELQESLSLAESSYAKAGKEIVCLGRKLKETEELADNAQLCFSKLLLE